MKVHTDVLQGGTIAIQGGMNYAQVGICNLFLVMSVGVGNFECHASRPSVLTERRAGSVQLSVYRICT